MIVSFMKIKIDSLFLHEWMSSKIKIAYDLILFCRVKMCLSKDSAIPFIPRNKDNEKLLKWEKTFKRIFICDKIKYCM